MLKILKNARYQKNYTACRSISYFKKQLTKRNVNTFLVLQRSTPMLAAHPGPAPFCPWDPIGARMGCPRGL